MEEKKFLPPHLLTYDGWTRAPRPDSADWRKKIPFLLFHNCGAVGIRPQNACTALERQPPHVRKTAKNRQESNLKVAKSAAKRYLFPCILHFRKQRGLLFLKSVCTSACMFVFFRIFAKTVLFRTSRAVFRRASLLAALLCTMRCGTYIPYTDNRKIQ